jgi:hypothetical protein
MIVSRRGILRSILSAPAIVAVDRIMPVKLWKPQMDIYQVSSMDGVITREPFSTIFVETRKQPIITFMYDNNFGWTDVMAKFPEPAL